MVILMDDEDRENEGDIIMAAEMVKPGISTSWHATRAADLHADDP